MLDFFRNTRATPDPELEPKAKMMVNPIDGLASSNELLYEDNFIKAEFLPDKMAVLVMALTAAIPEGNFRTAFRTVGDMVKIRGAMKLIFDKRKLRQFHEHSMIWYHIEWKTEMYDYGLRHHRKILPNDGLFISQVELGRQRIHERHPEFDFSKFDIQYFSTVEECLEN